MDNRRRHYNWKWYMPQEETNRIKEIELDEEMEEACNNILDRE